MILGITINTNLNLEDHILLFMAAGEYGKNLIKLFIRKNFKASECAKKNAKNNLSTIWRCESKADFLKERKKILGKWYVNGYNLFAGSCRRSINDNFQTCYILK